MNLYKINLIFILPLLISCNSNEKEKEREIPNHEYSEVKNLDSKWDDLFLKKDSDYFYYFYSEHCQHCFKIKNEVIDIALNNKKKIYFCADQNTVIRDYDISFTIGMDNIENVFINGKPSLIHIKNKKIINNIVGANSVINELRN